MAAGVSVHGEMWPEQKWDLRLQWQYVSIIIVHRIYHCGSWKGIPIWIAGIPQTTVGMVKCTVAPAAIPFPFLAFMSEHSSIVPTWNSQQLNTPSCKTVPYFPILSNTFQYFPILSNTFQYFPILSNTFQYFPILSNTFQYFPILSNTFQYFPILSNTFQYFPILSNTFQYFPILSNTFQYFPILSNTFQYFPIRSNTFQYVPIRSNTFQHVPTRSNTFQYVPIRSNTFQYVPIRSNTFQYVPIRSNTFQYVPILSNTFQYFPILSNTFQYFVRDPIWHVWQPQLPASAAWWKCPRKPLWPAMSISRKGQFWGVPSDYSNSINSQKDRSLQNPIRK